MHAMMEDQLKRMEDKLERRQKAQDASQEKKMSCPKEINA